MELLKIERVIVGSERRSDPRPVVKPAPPQSCHYESMQCCQCFITFSDPKAKDRHMRKSHRDLYKQHLQQNNTLFTCYKCEKSFSSSEELSQHQTSHRTEEKPFHCRYCQKCFLTFTELNKHRRHECVERRCPCRDCGALFLSPSRLRSHRIAVHPQQHVVDDDINTYQCCKCSCGFQTEEELLEHQERFASYLHCDTKPPVKKRGRKAKDEVRGGVVEGKKVKRQEEAGGHQEYDDSPTEGSHSNELQPELEIPCPETSCDLIFPSVSALRAHKREEHGPLPRAPSAFTECDESNARPEQLMTETHHSGHTRGKSFGRESALNVHQDTHTEVEKAAEQRKYL